MTYTRGSHTMKWGASVRLLRVTNITNVSGAGMFGNFTLNNTYTGNAYGDFLPGVPNNTQRIIARRRAEGFTRNWNFYWQDDWKATPWGPQYHTNGFRIVGSRPESALQV